MTVCISVGLYACSSRAPARQPRKACVELQGGGGRFTSDLIWKLGTVWAAGEKFPLRLISPVAIATSFPAHSSCVSTRGDMMQVVRVCVGGQDPRDWDAGASHSSTAAPLRIAVAPGHAHGSSPQQIGPRCSWARRARLTRAVAAAHALCALRRRRPS